MPKFDRSSASSPGPFLSSSTSPPQTPLGILKKHIPSVGRGSSTRDQSQSDKSFHSIENIPEDRIDIIEDYEQITRLILSADDIMNIIQARIQVESTESPAETVLSTAKVDGPGDGQVLGLHTGFQTETLMKANKWQGVEL